MGLEFWLIIIISIIVLAGGIAWVFWVGRLLGIREAMHEITRGVSAHYEYEGKPLPEHIAKCVDDMKAQVTRRWNAQDKCNAYRAHFFSLGYEMGCAAWQDGFDAGQRSMFPEDDELRIDLSLKELTTIHFLAHYGFENKMRNKDGLISFKNAKQAEEATLAIEELERKIPKDEREPHALSFNRQTMIWRKWPSPEKQAP